MINFYLKFVVITAGLVICLFLVPNNVQAASSTYEVEAGDSLWQISEEQLGSPWCWKAIASIPENNLDFQGILPVGKELILPERAECERMLSAISLNLEEIETSTIQYVFDQPWHASGLLPGSWIDSALGNDRSVYINGEDYDNMFKIRDELFFRERDGDKWYVVKNGQRSQAWDYVDKLEKNNETGTTFYRARDIKGRWYVIRNDKSTLLDFEPNRLSVNLELDQPIVYRVESGVTTVYSPNGNWQMDAELSVADVNTNGDILFVSVDDSAKVHVEDNDGSIKDIASSSLHNESRSYWLNDEYIGSTVGRMVTLYTSKPTAVQLRFYHREEAAMRAIAYYGAFGRVTFDEDGNLVVYEIFDVRLDKHVFKVK